MSIFTEVKSKYPGIVFLEFEGNKIIAFRKQDGYVIKQELPFFPFYFINNLSLLENFKEKYWKKELQGNNFYRYLCAFENWALMWRSLSTFNKKSRESKNPGDNAIYEQSDIFIKYEPLTQFLIQNQTGYFEEMKFEDLNRVQIDIFPYTFKEFNNAFKSNERIILIGMKSTSGDIKIIGVKEKDEISIIKEFIKTIMEWDPDIIEGHHLTTKLIPYLRNRADFYNIELTIGRNNEAINLQPAKFFDLDIYDIHIEGRLIFDLNLKAFLIDQNKKELENYGLTHVSRFFGSTELEDISIPTSKLGAYWNSDREILLEYLKKRLNAVNYLSNLFLPQYFFEASFVPLSFNDLLRETTSQKIEKIILRKYLSEKHSLPGFETRSAEPDSLNFLFYSGLYENVVHINLDSLLLSIIRTNNLFPEKDELSAIKNIAEDFLEHKVKLKKQLAGGVNSKYINRVREEIIVLKSFSDSFYYYLTSSKSIFYEIETAKRIINCAKEIIFSFRKELENKNIKLIHSDHQDLLVSYKNDFVEFRKNLDEASETIKSRFNIDFNHYVIDTYKKLLSYKKRNYILLTNDNKLLFKGSSFVSRSMEKYARDFLNLFLEAIIVGNFNSIPQIYNNLKLDIQNHSISINDLARSDIIKESYDEYKNSLQNGSRAHSALYELAIRYYGNNFPLGEKISYYITGKDTNIKIYENVELLDSYNPNEPNENTKYYIKKLDEYIERFSILFDQKDFIKLFDENMDLIERTDDPVIKETQYSDENQ